MKIQFKETYDLVWFRLVDTCPDYLNMEEFVNKLGGKVLSDGPFEYVINGIEFPSEAHYSWFLLKI